MPEAHFLYNVYKIFRKVFYKLHMEICSETWYNIYNF